jgi:hypothetical protein
MEFSELTAPRPSGRGAVKEADRNTTPTGGAGTPTGRACILGFIIGLISFILMLTRPDRKTIHDLVAGTVVLYDPDNVLAGS